MLKRRIRTLSAAGLTIVAAIVSTTLGATGASATTTAPASGHVTVPRPPRIIIGGSGCVVETFTEAYEPYYEPCVADAQILFNNLWNSGQADHLGTNQLLTVDGSYGPHTASDVGSFQQAWGLTVDEELGLNTWFMLCYENYLYGYRGVYWHDAGCATEPYLQ